MTGQVVSNYRILSEIGRGAMGAVYRAADIYLGRIAAVKFLSEKYSQDREMLLRFEREGRAASALSHPNICTVFDIGRWRERPFIAMELLEGSTLQKRMQAGPIPPAEALEIGIAVAGALEAAHAVGVVHRDIKPANVFLTHRGQVKVLDFGLAKMRFRPAQPLGDAAATVATFVTMPGRILGTLAYMAPEQFRGEEVDGRADLYSLGVLMHEALTGALPSQGRTATAPFAPILKRLVAADRRDRYDNARDLRAALAQLRGGMAAGCGR